MDKEQKSTFKKNIIQIIVWLILLLVCFVYILYRPAEKNSLLSGFTIMKEKISIFVESIQSGNSEIIENKYALEKYLEDISSVAEQWNCASAEIKEDIAYIYSWLTNNTTQELLENFSSYVKLVYEIDSKVKENCNIK